jgi:hypothetical protein
VPDPLSTLAGGVKDVVDALQEREDEQGRAWAVEALSKARLDWTSTLIERQSTAKPGAPGFTSELVKDFDDYYKHVVDDAPTPSAKKFMHERMAELRVHFGERAMVFEAGARVDYRTDKFNAAIDNTQKLMNTDPSQFSVALSEQLAVIDASALPPDKRSAMRQAAVDRIAGAAVWAQVNRSPVEFMRSVGMYGGKAGVLDLQGKTGNAAFDILPFDKRIEMVSQAINLKARIDADADRAAERERKMLADEAMKGALDRLFPGNDKPPLDRQFVENIRPLLSHEEYKSLLVGMEKVDDGPEGGKSDPETFRRLQSGLYRNPEGVVGAALVAHRNHLLSNTDLSSILTKAHELDRQGGPKTEYERTRQRIVDNLDPGPLVQDPIGKGRFAEALYAFDKWSNSGKHTDDEISKRGFELVNQYRFINLSDTVAGLPKPRYGDVRRNPGDPGGMLQDVARAYENTKKAYADKKITKDEFNSEVSNLNKWRKSAGAK